MPNINATKEQLENLFDALRASVYEDYKLYKSSFPNLVEPNFKKLATWLKGDFDTKQGTKILTARKSNLLLFISYRDLGKISFETIRNYDTTRRGLRKYPQKGFERRTLTVLCKYIGKTSWENFVRTYNKSTHSADNIESLVKDDSMVFVISYFSILTFRVKQFLLAIDIKSYAEYTARVWGFHYPDNLILRNKLEYSGDGTKKGGYRYFRLDKSRFSKELHLMLAIENEDMPFSEVNFFRGSLQGTSINDSNGGILNFQITGQKIHSKPKDLSLFLENWMLKLNNDSLIRNSFLATRINSFRVRKSFIAELPKLETKDNRTSDYIKLIGKYRIWNFGRKAGVIKQTKFEITNQGNAHISSYTEEEIEKLRKKLKNTNDESKVKEINNLENQPCILHPSGVNGNKLMALTFNSRVRVSNIAVFDVDTALKPDEIIPGSFVIMGNQEEENFTEYFVMVKDETDFKPENININEINNDNLLFRRLLNNLKHLIQKNVWYLNDNLSKF